MQDESPEKEAVEKAAASEPDPDPEKLERLRAYDASQTRIRTDTARMKREYDREIKGGGSSGSDNSSSPPPSGKIHLLTKSPYSLIFEKLCSFTHMKDIHRYKHGYGHERK